MAKRPKGGASSLSPVRIEISAVVPMRVEQLYGLATWGGLIAALAVKAFARAMASFDRGVVWVFERFGHGGSRI
ncbi:hypothetical protein CU102_26100 [Phyllobacterium brassicacearum]|uniref:Uncharacterized protein n=1 Tax=Phyllobacterium brassicacearum TaxID=314235 RepID=A0A2P7B6F3_9HYPH|nr:hypothetical protein [Phyllobacterium brassicacearum]PSH62044.1 hypothetical protein CU102_26100 [Phyllobacterium brassicacearum]